MIKYIFTYAESFRKVDSYQMFLSWFLVELFAAIFVAKF